MENSASVSMRTNGVPVHRKQSWWRRRSRLERVLLIGVVVAFVILIILIAVLAHLSASSSTVPDLCLNEQCVRTAAAILDSIDPSADPCDDFFQFACGKWNRNHPIPEERTKYDVFASLNDGLQEKLRIMLERPVSNRDIPVVVNAKYLYQSCLNTTALTEREASTLTKISNEFGGWPAIDRTWAADKFDLTNTLRLIRRTFLYTPVLNIFIGPDEKNSSVNTLIVDQSQLPMMNREFYLRGRQDRLIQVYEKFAVDFLVEIGADRQTATKDVDDLINFEIQLANITVPMDRRRLNRETEFVATNIGGLVRNYTKPIDWLRLFTSIFNEVHITVDNDEPVSLRSPDFIQKLGTLVEKTSNRTLQNYAVWWIVMINNEVILSQRLQNLRKDLNKAMTGTEQDNVRWRICANYLNQIFGIIVGRMYVDEYFGEDARDNALEMVKHVRSSFSQILREVPWMKEQTKLVALSKVEAIRAKIGYPDFIMDNEALNSEYSGVHCHPDKFVENVLNISRSDVQKGLSTLRSANDRDKWYNTPVTPNAFYHPSKNIIMFPAGILQPPFYHKDNPMYLNFGGIATIIGHEITHGFDDIGRLYDKDGNVNQWWSEDDIRQFKEKARCIVEQYGNYTMPEIGRNINGILTLGENIADNGGLKQSYRAYMNWVNEHGAESLLPGVNYSQQQLFFINFAQSWCGSSRPEILVRWINSFQHSPRNIRVVGTLSNSADFAKAFSCRPGSYMNPVKKCSVW